MKINNNTYNLESFDIKAHTIYVHGEIDLDSSKKAIEAINDVVLDDALCIKRNEEVLKETMLLDMNKTNLEWSLPPIDIHLSTYGGICESGMALYDTIKNVGKHYQTNMICSGCIMSYGVILLQSAKRRISFPNTTFMIHQVATYRGYSKLKDAEDDVIETRRINDLIFDILLKRTKLSEEKLKEIYEKKKDWFMDAQTALEYGIIDEIMG